MFRLNSSSPVESLFRGLRPLFRWAHPDWEKGVYQLEIDDWRDQHSEISKTIWNLTSVLVGACLFCLFVLSAPDANLVSTDADIKIPIASITASYADFLTFGPLFLLGVGLYLHVFIEQRLRLGRPNSAEFLLKIKPLSPYIFNLESTPADLLSIFLFYAMLPCVLAFFVWKAIPRPQDVWPLTFIFIVSCILMLALKIRRFRPEARRLSAPCSKLALGGLWTMLAFGVLLFFPIAWHTGQSFLKRLQVPGGAAQESVAISSDYFPFVYIRRLQLFGASLAKKKLSGFFAPYADLRKADLRETDLEGANLSGADLRKTDLTGANLRSADLRGAHLEGASLKGARLEHADLRQVTFDDDTDIDQKWRMVICIVNGILTRECIGREDLAWVDLSGAKLDGSNLQKAQMTGVNLKQADLSEVVLGGANLRLADLRSTLSQDFFKDAASEGALLSGPLQANSMNEVVVAIMNRLSGNCLQSPSEVKDGTPLFLGSKACEPKQKLGNQLWSMNRLPNGFLRIKFRKGDYCVDGTAFYDRRPLQMWDCSDDSENQYWRIIPIPEEGSYVLIQKNNTGFCWSGAGTRDNGPQPYVAHCNREDHNQYWEIFFPLLPESQQLHFPHGLITNERREDLLEISTNFSISPEASPYGGSSSYERTWYPYRRKYGRPEVPERRDAFPQRPPAVTP